jgi:hypothetical protein
MVLHSLLPWSLIAKPHQAITVIHNYITVNMLNSEIKGNPENKIINFSAPNYLLNNLIKYFTTAYDTTNIYSIKA